MNYETPVNNDAIKQWSITPEGYLQIDIPIARPGVLVYDQKRGDAFTAREYRSEQELFNQDSINTLIGKPVTLSPHPRWGVNAGNYRAVSVGIVSAAFREGDDLIARVEVRDEKAISTIQKDKRLRGASAGYRVRNKISQNGQAPNGDNYDTVDEGIEYNHVTITRNPRVRTAIFNLDGEPMDLDEALEKISKLEASNMALTTDLSRTQGELLKANNKLINMDSLNTESYERGVADGRQENALRESAKKLKIDADALGDIKLVKMAVIKKANPQINTDSWSDEQIDVALSMALVTCASQFEQSKPVKLTRQINNDEQADDINAAHFAYQQKIFRKTGSNQ